MSVHHIVDFRSPHNFHKMLTCIDCGDFMDCGGVYGAESAEVAYQNAKLFTTIHMPGKERFPLHLEEKTTVSIAIVSVPPGSKEARKYGEPEGCYIITLIHTVGASVWRIPVTTFLTIAQARAYVGTYCGEQWTEEGGRGRT